MSYVVFMYGNNSGPKRALYKCGWMDQKQSNWDNTFLSRWYNVSEATFHGLSGKGTRRTKSIRLLVAIGRRNFYCFLMILQGFTWFSYVFTSNSIQRNFKIQTKFKIQTNTFQKSNNYILKSRRIHFKSQTKSDKYISKFRQTNFKIRPTHFLIQTNIFHNSNKLHNFKNQLILFLKI